jgi:hypothetical protein
MFNDPSVMAKALQQEGISLARKFAPKGGQVGGGRRGKVRARSRGF